MPIWRVKKTLDSAKRIGFKGRTRKQALEFVLQLEEKAWKGIPRLHLVAEDL
jgi:hypothetical protein